MNAASLRSSQGLGQQLRFVCVATPTSANHLRNNGSQSPDKQQQQQLPRQNLASSNLTHLTQQLRIALLCIAPSDRAGVPRVRLQLQRFAITGTTPAEQYRPAEACRCEAVKKTRADAAASTSHPSHTPRGLCSTPPRRLRVVQTWHTETGREQWATQDIKNHSLALSSLWLSDIRDSGHGPPCTKQGPCAADLQHRRGGGGGEGQRDTTTTHSVDVLLSDRRGFKNRRRVASFTGPYGVGGDSGVSCTLLLLMMKQQQQQLLPG
ncbi:unnamed protein product [Lampetra fluviatilis]